MLTFIEELTGVGRHGLFLLVPTLRAGDGGLENDLRSIGGRGHFNLFFQ